MKTRRKRTNSKVPAKGRLRELADQLWSLAIRDDWAGKCAVCGSRKCEAHHLIPRQKQATRYDLRNGIALCAMHHQFDADISPHQNAAGWLEWLADQCPFRHRWYTEYKRKPFTGTTNAIYYCDVIRRLKQYVDEDDYTRIVGQKFGAWLEEQERKT